MNDDIAAACKGLTRDDLLNVIDRLVMPTVFSPETALRMVRDHVKDVRLDKLQREADRLWAEYLRLNAERRALFPASDLEPGQGAAYLEHLRRGEAVYERYRRLQDKITATFETH